MKYPLFHFLRYLKLYWIREFVVVILMIIVSILSLAFPYFIKILIDEAIPQKNFQLLITLLIVFFLIEILSIILSAFLEYNYRWISNHIMKRIRLDVFAHFINLPLSFYNLNKNGDLVHRIMNEVEVIQKALSASFLRLFRNVFTITGLVIILSILNYQLFLLGIITLPFIFLNVKYFQPHIKKFTKLSREKYSFILHFLIERFDSIKLIKAYNSFDYEQSKLTKEIKEFVKLNLRSVFYSISMTRITALLVSIAPIIILGWGGHSVIIGSMSLGALIAFFQYFERIYDPFRDLMSLYVDLVRAQVSMKRVFEFINIPKENIENLSPIENFKYEKIVFQNVSFAYNGISVLKNINLIFNKGKKYAIVGPSGCGKSTITSLLCKYYLPTSGQIKINDKNLTQLNLYDLRQNIRLVLQDPIMFHDTIYENIKYNSPIESNKEVTDAAKRVNLYEEINNQEQGFNSIIGDKGTKLSGGQLQRIALARSSITDYEVLIMDEATSALDSQNEKIIINDLLKKQKDKTIIVVSHRLSTIKDMDEIICLNNGEVVEKGNHFDLINRKGFYFDLFKEQIER